jgi:hypothetical protein
LGVVGHNIQEAGDNFNVGLGVIGNNIQSGCNSIADFLGM